RPPTPTPFPYTTLFRSSNRRRPAAPKRGAVSRPPGRFAREHREPVADPLAGTVDDTDGTQSPSPATQVASELARRVITRNESPRSEEHTSQLQSRENLV